ncbi:MinD superfamily P-loop ATPase [Mangrovibacterium marinum]|uniref:MinD superfamily P-loop ATPase n=1 Tax=Mangrovibacterium marinum TaxID=1639118 RepID=A0A2T5C365_9BACT|nr:ATP-binding protein [Mangrovibacterium marinum]PTN09213.1 MinD superfamily P-loop ATPase [Mangrovibacterium marinum]
MKIAIASGKGGTGKTLVSTNLFNVIRQTGQKTQLIDCDAEEPNVCEFIRGKVEEETLTTTHIPVIDARKCTFCGKCQEYCSYNAIIMLPAIKTIQVVEDLCHDCGACVYACQYDAITEKEKVTGSITQYAIGSNADLLESQTEIGIYSPVPIIGQTINMAEAEALTLLDSPPGTSCPFIATVERADYVVLVTEPTPFGLNDLKLSVETLRRLKKKFGVVINRFGLGKELIEDYLKREGIALLEHIPFDKRIARVYAKGELITEELPEYHDLFGKLYQNIMKQVQA